jgi:putative flippase GtrA
MLHAYRAILLPIMHGHLHYFPRFVIVGGLGFAADASVFFTLVHGLSWDWAPARCTAFLVAVGLTWAGNRAITFRSRGKPGIEGLRHLGFQSIGCGVNYVTFLIVVQSGVADHGLLIPYLAGTAVALLFNYTTARRYVYYPR